MEGKYLIISCFVLVVAFVLVREFAIRWNKDECPQRKPNKT